MQDILQLLKLWVKYALKMSNTVFSNNLFENSITPQAQVRDPDTEFKVKVIWVMVCSNNTGKTSLGLTN